MQLWKKLLLAASPVIGFGFALSAPAAVIYDSNGFTATRFSAAFVNTNDATVVGNLRGQDTGTITNGWRQAGVAGGTGISNAVIDVNGGLTGAGDQGVRLTRVGEDNRWSPIFSDPSKIISVAWRMRVNATTQTNLYGPFFGVELNDDDNISPATAHRPGAFGVDARTGELLYYTPGGLDILPGDPTVTLGTWNQFETIVDFNTKTYSGYLNGAAVFTNAPFLDNAALQLDEAFITGLRAAAGADGNDTGTAFVDNYTVTSVPEPASALLLSLGGLALLRRSRRIA